MDFLSKNEKKLENEFTNQGLIIREVADKNALNKIQQFVFDMLSERGGEYLDSAPEVIDINDLNNFRLEVINKINAQSWLREAYYQVAKPYLDLLVGNELAMQSRVNLSIQLPNDKSSLLPVHSDVWSGDSPFETVVWLPLVDCYKTKSMFILPPKKYEKIKKIFLQKKFNSSEMIYKKIKKDLIWINIKFGQVLVFNQCLPHGNTVNHEKETRWSLNCRFKSIFSPHRDKKIGEFFEPITLRKVSELAINYKLPKIK